MIESANNFSIQYVFKFMRLWCKKDSTCERTQDTGALPVKRKSAAVIPTGRGSGLKIRSVRVRIPSAAPLFHDKTWFLS